MRWQVEAVHPPTVQAMSSKSAIEPDLVDGGGQLGGALQLHAQIDACRFPGIGTHPGVTYIDAVS